MFTLIKNFVVLNNQQSTEREMFPEPISIRPCADGGHVIVGRPGQLRPHQGLPRQRIRQLPHRHDGDEGGNGDVQQ